MGIQTRPSEVPAAVAGIPAVLARSPQLVELWYYWQSKLRGRDVLPRADFLPYEIPKMLDIITLIERTPDGRLRYRVAGSKVVSAYGFEVTGKFLNDILSPDRMKIASAHIGTVLSEARPVFSRTQYLSPTGLDVVNSRLNIPLSDSAGAATLVLAGNIIEWTHALEARFGDGGLAPEADVLEVL
jgi:hypothetical protein